jgi:hypothetical protein
LEAFQQDHHDFIESLVFSSDQMVLMTGTLTDEVEHDKV